MEVAKLFAHIGLKTIDEVAGERHGRTYTDYKAGAVSQPVFETQVQMLLARFCFATRLNCLARSLPSIISQSTLRIVDDLLAATEAGGSEAVAVVQQAALIAFNDLGSAVGKSRVLCKGL